MWYALIDERYQDLLKAMKLEPDNSKENAKYYTLVDIYQLAEIRFGKKFRIYLEENFDYLEFLLNTRRQKWRCFDGRDRFWCF